MNCAKPYHGILWASQWLVVKHPTANVGDARDSSSIAGLGRSPEGGNGNPLQCSCLENSMDRETVHGATKVRHN